MEEPAREDWTRTEPDANRRLAAVFDLGYHFVSLEFGVAAVFYSK